MTNHRMGIITYYRVMSNLAACGACPSDADGELTTFSTQYLTSDCASLPGVNEVRCDQGKCVIGWLNRQEAGIS